MTGPDADRPIAPESPIEPCPSWCQKSHRSADKLPADEYDATRVHRRAHMRRLGYVTRTTEDFTQRGCVRTISVYLVQDIGARRARIWLEIDEPTGNSGVWPAACPGDLEEAIACFTLAEGEQLAELVEDALRFAREG